MTRFNRAVEGIEKWPFLRALAVVCTILAAVLIALNNGDEGVLIFVVCSNVDLCGAPVVEFDFCYCVGH